MELSKEKLKTAQKSGISAILCHKNISFLPDIVKILGNANSMGVIQFFRPKIL